MGYVRTHWHAMLVGAAAYWVITAFVMPKFITKGEG